MHQAPVAPSRDLTLDDASASRQTRQLSSTAGVAQSATATCFRLRWCGRSDSWKSARSWSSALG